MKLILICSLFLLQFLSSEIVAQEKPDSLYYNGYRIVREAEKIKTFDELVIDSLLIEQKSVFLSTLLSAEILVPGLSQHYNGEHAKGFVILGLVYGHAGLYAAAINSIESDQARLSQNQATVMIWSAIAISGTLIYSIFDGISTTVHYNDDVTAKWKSKYPEIIEKWESSQ
ncbi:MAG: hypothetical protein J0L62_09705 [Bacteroidetes bacterium]|nr:hypothetical protein [Bacteroidota bacterium]